MFSIFSTIIDIEEVINFNLNIDDIKDIKNWILYNIDTICIGFKILSRIKLQIHAPGDVGCLPISVE